MAKLITVDALDYVYPDGTPALFDINLEIAEEEFIAFIGQNGSGKTTLSKCLNGLLRPTQGSIIVDDLDTRQRGIIKQLVTKVGYVFQNPDHQIFAQTVYEEVSFTPKLLGLTESEIDKRVKDSLESVGLSKFVSEDPFSLTKGDRQKLAVASVLSSKPEIIILDEPTTGLDYKELLSMMNLLKGLNSIGHTIIIITHSIHIVASYSHRVIVMDRGKILLDGTTREVFQKEDELAKAHIKLPSLTSLGNSLGYTLLSIDEFKDIMVKQ